MRSGWLSLCSCVPWLALATACSDGGAADPGTDPGVDASINGAPFANAGPDRAAPPDTRVVLDGRASTDPEGEPLTYSWLLVSAPAASAATLTGDTLATPEIVVDVVGFYEVSLRVHDGTQWSAPDATRIAVMDDAPLADAGDDATVARGAVVSLDGSGSVDPWGDPLTYAWTLIAAPAGSTATLAGNTTVAPTFTADVLGAYTVQLVVSDGSSSSAPDTVTITAVNTPPVAEAGADVVLQLGDTAALDGGASSDGDGDPLTFAWEVTSRPVGSVAMPASPDAAQTAFTPDAEGEFVLTLTVSDGVATATDTVQVLVEADVELLDHDVVDAEYSAALDRIITLSTGTEVFVIDPDTGDRVEITLPLAGTSLALSPDGTEAVVGHDGWLSHLDLLAPEVIDTHPVTAPVGDVVHGGNGWAYALPSEDQWEHVRSIDLTTGEESEGTGWSFRAGSVGRKHPTMAAFYVADRGISPSDIERYDIDQGPSVYRYDSPYHGDYAMCGDLWFSETGDRIFTRCGNVFRATQLPMTDMTYAGSVQIGITWMTHSALSGTVVVIPANDWDNDDLDTELRFFEDDFLASIGASALPLVRINQQLVPSHGRFVFADADGETLHVIARVTGTVVRDVLWSTTY